MTTYRAPLNEMTFVLENLADLEGVAALPGWEEAWLAQSWKKPASWRARCCRRST